MKVPPSAHSTPATPAITTATAEAAWKHAVETFAAKNALEADTIRAIAFHTVKADQIEVLVPTTLEKKIHYLRSPRNLEVLERALDEKLGAKMSIVYKIANPANRPPSRPSRPHPPRNPASPRRRPRA